MGVILAGAAVVMVFFGAVWVLAEVMEGWQRLAEAPVGHRETNPRDVRVGLAFLGLLVVVVLGGVVTAGL